MIRPRSVGRTPIRQACAAQQRHRRLSIVRTDPCTRLALGGESQGDSILQPRVGAEAPTLGQGPRQTGPTLKGLHPFGADEVARRGATLSGLSDGAGCDPRVARWRVQPWAARWNAVGVLCSAMLGAGVRGRDARRDSRDGCPTKVSAASSSADHARAHWSTCRP